MSTGTEVQTSITTEVAKITAAREAISSLIQEMTGDDIKQAIDDALVQIEGGEDDILREIAEASEEELATAD